MTASLIVLVPLLVLAIVVLFAFAGCTPFDAATEKPTTPGPGTTPTTPTQPPSTPTSEPYRDAILADTALKAYWRLGDGAGATAAADSVPQKKHPGGYQTGATLATPGVLKLGKGPDEGCGVFDGAQGYVVVPFNEDFNPPLDFSVEAWVRPNLIESGRYVVVGCYRENPDRGFALFVRQAESGEQTAGAWVGGGGTSEKVETPLGSGSEHDGWRHLVMTYDRLNMVLAIHVRAGTAPPTTDDNTGVSYDAMTDADPRELRIGAGRGGGTGDPVREQFPGRIDEVAIYDGVLGSGAISNHFLLATTP